MTYEWGNCLFVAQIVVAELVFMYSYPRRSLFFLRLALCICAVTALSGLYPSIPYEYSNQLYPFFKYIILFAATVIGMSVCFKVKAVPLLSACSAGYALQHLSYQMMNLVSLTPLFENAGVNTLSREHLLELIVFPVCYVIIWLFFGRLAARYEFYKNYDSRLIFVSVFALFICLVINRFTRQGASLGNTFVIAGNALYAISCCVLALFINFNLHVLSVARARNEILERIGYEGRRQYEASKKNRELINIKYHDLKHVLSLLDSDKNDAELAQYRKVLEEYDSEVRSGNETLDIVVNEKADICRQEGITFTFFGDGKLLSFVSQYDVYSLFGNILDNAIEATRKIEDKTKRVISMTIEAQGNCITVSCLNYFAGKLRLDDGVLATTKTDNVESHGFGIRSIQLISEKYGGEIKIAARGDVFELNVFLIMPQ